MAELFHIVGDLESALMNLLDYRIGNPTMDLEPMLTKYNIKYLIDELDVK